ncbi:class I SAM-dependent RNA methyltransferase [Sphingobium sufflavum]|uniref:class I SAM-dependent RNA methyltransferase n=1 Tax=Sphingobium sufflavum TaxID=1129547 RepID=UPI001F19344F|nr:class I SAM-dependent RNA methyltransferase [Sphingobium sufflavum]MCE7798554.1 class I SAM-dependent RNA methyltransferase [Sphingobium sufflavum]
MSDTDRIVRIAAKGDGVTADGRHVPLSAPGDRIAADGRLEHGPDHVAPPCHHFPECGGCQLQHLSDPAYAAYVHDRVAGALTGQGIEGVEVEPPHVSPPRSRRRASLKAARVDGRVQIGFASQGSNRIVDMTMCELLHPALFALVAPLRKLLAREGVMGRSAGIVMALADQGVDLLLEDVRSDGLASAEAFSAFATAHGLARLTLAAREEPPMRVWEPEPVTVSFGGLAVPLPPGAFLQATQDGEAALVDEVVRGVAGATTAADLFAGLGTFALSLAKGRKVYAAEASRDALFALKRAGDSLPGRVFVEHRDLFRRPLVPAELNRFGAVVLDPPRAGARDQVEQIAASTAPRLVYVSCNPSSFARDAVTLIEGGYRLDRVRPVGQFRWSTHVELAACFTRAKGD